MFKKIIDFFKYDSNGFDKNGYDRQGYDRQGFKEGYDRQGYDRQGYDRQGYDRDGFHKNGYDRQGYDRQGYDRQDFNRESFSREGKHKDTGNEYDPQGYNQLGFNKKGENRQGETESEVFYKYILEIFEDIDMHIDEYNYKKIKNYLYQNQELYSLDAKFGESIINGNLVILLTENGVRQVRCDNNLMLGRKLIQHRIGDKMQLMNGVMSLIIAQESTIN